MSPPPLHSLIRFLALALPGIAVSIEQSRVENSSRDGWPK